jgi:hypothetical protein
VSLEPLQYEHLQLRTVSRNVRPFQKLEGNLSAADDVYRRNLRTWSMRLGVLLTKAVDDRPAVVIVKAMT